MTHAMFDNPDDLPALARYAALLPTIPALAPVLLHAPEEVPAMMAALGGITDEATLEAMAADPNISAEALAYLAGPFPAAFCANPVFPLLLLENPSLPAHMPPVSLGRLLAHGDVPADFVGAVVACGRPEMAEAARLHVAVAGELGAGWRDALVKALERVVALPDDLLPLLVTLGLLPAWLAPRLMGADAMVWALADRSTAEPVEPQLNAPSGRAARAADSATPRDELWALADDEESAVRAALARNPAFGPHDLAELKAREDRLDNDPVVYQAIAAEPRTPPAILLDLAGYSLALFTGVRRALAVNPSTPATALEVLADEPYAADIRLALARHPNLGSAQRQRMIELSLEAALGSGAPIYRAIALGQPGASPQALALAEHSPHWLERLALALNPAATMAALAHLAQDGNSLVRAAARSQRN